MLLPLTFAWFQYSFIEQAFDPHIPCPSLACDGPDRLHRPRIWPPTTRDRAECFARILAWFDAFPLVPPPYRAPSREQSQSQIDGWAVEDIELYNSIAFHV